MPLALLLDTAGSHANNCLAAFRATCPPSWDVELFDVYADPEASPDWERYALVIRPTSNTWFRREEAEADWERGVPHVEPLGSNTAGELPYPPRLFVTVTVGGEIEGNEEGETAWGQGLELDCTTPDGIAHFQSYAAPAAAGVLCRCFETTSETRTLQERWSDARSMLRQLADEYPAWSPERGYGVVQHDAALPQGLAPRLEPPVDVEAARVLEEGSEVLRVQALPLLTPQYVALAVEVDGVMRWRSDQPGSRGTVQPSTGRIDVRLPPSRSAHRVTVYAVGEGGARSYDHPQASTDVAFFGFEQIEAALVTSASPATESNPLRTIWQTLVERLRLYAPEVGVSAEDIVGGEFGTSMRPPSIHVFVFPGEPHQRARRHFGQLGRDYPVQIFCVGACDGGRDVTGGRSMEAICTASEMATRVASLLAAGLLPWRVVFDPSEPLVLADADATSATVSIALTVSWNP